MLVSRRVLLVSACVVGLFYHQQDEFDSSVVHRLHAVFDIVSLLFSSLHPCSFSGSSFVPAFSHPFLVSLDLLLCLPLTVRIGTLSFVVFAFLFFGVVNRVSFLSLDFSCISGQAINLSDPLIGP